MEPYVPSQHQEARTEESYDEDDARRSHSLNDEQDLEHDGAHPNVNYDTAYGSGDAATPSHPTRPHRGSVQDQRMAFDPASSASLRQHHSRLQQRSTFQRQPSVQRPPDFLSQPSRQHQQSTFDQQPQPSSFSQPRPYHQHALLQGQALLQQPFHPQPQQVPAPPRLAPEVQAALLLNPMAVQQVLLNDASWVDFCLWNIRNLPNHSPDRMTKALQLLRSIIAQLGLLWTASGRNFENVNQVLFERLVRGVEEVIELVEECFERV